MLFCLIKQVGVRQKKSKYIKCLKQLILLINLLKKLVNRIPFDDLGARIS